MDIIILDITGIKGNCTLKGYTDKVILNSFSHGVSLPMMGDMGNTERTAGRPHFSEMSFSKVTDQSTPLLYAACAQGKKLGTATIYVGRNESGEFMELLKYELTNAMVANINTSGGGMSPSDSFALAYTGIKTYFTQQNPDSTKKGTADFGWDLTLNHAA